MHRSQDSHCLNPTNNFYSAYNKLTERCLFFYVLLVQRALATPKVFYLHLSPLFLSARHQEKTCYPQTSLSTLYNWRGSMALPYDYSILFLLFYITWVLVLVLLLKGFGVRWGWKTLKYHSNDFLILSLSNEKWLIHLSSTGVHKARWSLLHKTSKAPCWGKSFAVVLCTWMASFPTSGCSLHCQRAKNFKLQLRICRIIYL
jgi:hypothetical protein